ATRARAGRCPSPRSGSRSSKSARSSRSWSTPARAPSRPTTRTTKKTPRSKTPRSELGPGLLEPFGGCSSELGQAYHLRHEILIGIDSCQQGIGGRLSALQELREGQQVPALVALPPGPGYAEALKPLGCDGDDLERPIPQRPA